MEEKVCKRESIMAQRIELKDRFMGTERSTTITVSASTVPKALSGVELALMVTGREREYPEPFFSEEKSEEYWTGWALAYYQ